jgi:spoIIIJ-associated protein
MDVQVRVREFLEQTLGAMGVTTLEVVIEDTPDSVRLDLTGEGGEVLLQRRGETLDALQHIVNTAFRRELDGDRSFVLDCMGFRRGKDAELQQMARFSMEKVKSAGVQQEIGPLNPYARRLVHITVATDPQLTSESIGDAFLKTVIISLRR